MTALGINTIKRVAALKIEQGLSLPQIKATLALPQAVSAIQHSLYQYAAVYGIPALNPKPHPRKDPRYWDTLQEAYNLRASGKGWSDVVVAVGWHPEITSLRNRTRSLTGCVKRFCREKNLPYPGGRMVKGRSRFDDSREMRLYRVREAQRLRQTQGMTWDAALMQVGWTASSQAAKQMLRRWEGRQ
jgi:hypothetical protein